MIRALLARLRRARLAARHPSFRVFYSDGHVSVPLMHDDATTRARLFGGEVRYCRDADGNLLDAADCRPIGWWSAVG